MKFLLTFKHTTTKIAEAVVEVPTDALNFTAHTDEEKRDRCYAVIAALNREDLLKLAEGKWEVLKGADVPYLSQTSVISDEERR